MFLMFLSNGNSVNEILENPLLCVKGENRHLHKFNLTFICSSSMLRVDGEKRQRKVVNKKSVFFNNNNPQNIPSN